MKRTLGNLLCCSTLLALAACAPAAPSSPPAGYPPVNDPSSQGYPPPADTVVPPSWMRPFRLDKPLVEGATAINGSGVPGVPIRIEDVTFMGKLIGSVKIGEDGRFSLSVAPLERNHRLGIALDSLAGTEFLEDSFEAAGFRGDEAMMVPQAGYYFDTALVKPPAG